MPYFEVQLTQKLHRVYDVAHDTWIGRAPQCTIQLLSRAVSRRHARLEIGDDGQAVVSDLGTKNGIRLDGQRVQGAAVVRDGSQLVVGDISMVYRAADRKVADRDVVDLRGRAPGPSDAEAAAAPKASFLLSADPEAVAAFGSYVARQRIQNLELEEITRFKLQVALKEALDNAVVHGCQRDASKSVQVTVFENDEEFLISVRDPGPGYDVEGVLSNVEEVDALDAIRNRPSYGAGLGLRIILNCVDRLQFEGRGAVIHMGRFKEAGQIFVISDDSDEGAVAEGAAPPPAPAEAGPAPQAPGGSDPFLSDESDPIRAPHRGPAGADATPGADDGTGPLNMDDLL